jgi:hypothetical protein
MANLMYRNMIREDIARMGAIGVDPRHVEAYMRLEHSTLDGLSRQQWQSEVALAVECVKADGPDNAEACARSYGL